jgi:hypothetical protein
MCDIGTAALVLSTGGGLAARGASAAMGRTNAAFARAEEAQIRQIGRQNEATAVSRMDRIIAQQRGQYLARGIALSSTSVQDAGRAAATERFMEAQAQRWNTDQAATQKANEAIISDYKARVGLMTDGASVVSRGLGQALDLWPQLMGT